VKFFAAFLSALAIAGCKAAPRVKATPTPPALRLAQCDGPATSLPDSLARQLRPRTGHMIPDDRWADLATTTPGGFAGVFRDSSYTPILMLTDPSQASAAKRALEGKIGVPLQQATVRQARWDFAQLVDWFNYLLPRVAAAGLPITADKDESLNRVRFSVVSIEQRDKVVAALAALPVPCDLVVVDLNGLIVRF